MRKLAQNPSSFLDSVPVGCGLDEFAADGPLFAELFENVGEAFEPNENINIMDSEDEMEQYINQKVSGSESESSTETKPLTILNLEELRRRAQKEKNQQASKSALSFSDASDTHRRHYIDEDNESDRRAKCMSKNAIMARENRQRKKQYLENLESKCERLSAENLTLKSSIQSKDKQLKSMTQEIEYLRNVLVNETGLSALLKNIQHTAGLKFGTSFIRNKETEGSEIQSGKRSADISSQNILGNKKQKTNHVPSVTNMELSTQTYEGPPTPCASPEPKTSGGVCLHVSNNNVSLEFCSSCASSAAEVWKVAGDHNYNRVHKQHETSDYVVVKEEVADYVVVKQEATSTDDESG